MTIWGHGLGTARGDSYVTVGGQRLESDSDYQVWGEAWPTPFWSRITFWLGSAMGDGPTEITVTVGDKTSAPLPFTIRSGRIFFVAASGADGTGSLSDPFVYTQASGGSGFVAGMQPGDLYYFRAGTYDSRANGGNSVLWIRNSEPSGEAGRPIAMLAYPGDTPRIFVASYNVNFRTGIKFGNEYMVFSGFQIDSEWMAASLASYHRFIGNDLIGLKDQYGSGTGTLVTGGSGNKILGNAIHGGRSKSRFDHATYFSGCADIVGNHLGWNYVYDNDFGRGPVLSINHQENRCDPGTQILKAHFVFNNIVDCSPQRAVAINVYDLSYDPPEPAPEPTFVYNNLFMNCGTLDRTDTDNIGWAPTVIANTADTRFYNNVLYNSAYVAFSVGSGILSTEFRNNIVVMNSSEPLDGRNSVYIDDNSPENSRISDNLFFDMGSSTIDATGVDTATNILDQDPKFTDPSGLDFSLQSDSPAINAGADDLLFDVPPPDYAPIDHDMINALRSGGFDLGVREYP
ncbi:MAG: DUF5123 domain-containing protein [Deltaproteobacteria bacterium]|nr:DUF5123 domain-containing protein [Deltaproteobacteria bacterium]